MKNNSFLNASFLFLTQNANVPDFYLMSDFSKEMHPQFSLVGFKNGLIDVSTNKINASCLITSIHPRPLPPILLGLYWTPL